MPSDSGSDGLRGFVFRDYEAGPRRDIARNFAEFASDMDRWLLNGPKKDAALAKLLEARAAALEVAQDMLRQ